MGGFAARRRAGIEHPLSGSQFEQARRKLRRGVLNGEQAFGEPRQCVNRGGRLDSKRVGCVPMRCRVEAGAGEAVGQRVLVDAPPDSKPQPSGLVVRRDDVGPAVGPVLPQDVQQPIRMRQPLIAAREPFQQVLAFALESPENRVDQRHGPGLAELAGALGAFIDGGVLGGPVLPQLEQSDQDEAPEVAVTPLQRPPQQLRGQPVQCRQPAEDAKGQETGE